MHILKKVFLYFGMKLKWDINIIIFACQQINMSIEFMGEDSIFIMKAEHIYQVPNEKDFGKKKTLIHCLLFMYESLGEEKKRQKLVKFALMNVFSPLLVFRYQLENSTASWKISLVLQITKKALKWQFFSLNYIIMIMMA